MTVSVLCSIWSATYCSFWLSRPEPDSRNNWRTNGVERAAICMVGVLMILTDGISHTQAEEPLLDTEILFERGDTLIIVVANRRTVLAFAHGCRLLRQSEDGGETWSDAMELEGRTGNAVVDANSGDILIVCPKAEFLLRSSDHGKSWIREALVIKPNAVGHGVGEIPLDVRSSESGITLRFDKHEGRLVMPARIQPPNGNNAQESWPYNYNTAIYSDDSGKTWQTSSPVQSGTGEGTLAELSDGRVYYNSRCHMAVDHRRRIAWSHDGGNMWVDWQVSRDLFEVGGPHYFKHSPNPSYGCNAGLVRVPDVVTGGKDVLLFSTPDNPGSGDSNARVRMTVWASFDRGKSWPVKRLVYKGPCAYSSLAADKNGTIFLLFDNGVKRRNERVSVARFNLEWLTEGQDWRKLSKNQEADK